MTGQTHDEARRARAVAALELVEALGIEGAEVVPRGGQTLDDATKHAVLTFGDHPATDQRLLRLPEPEPPKPTLPSETGAVVLASVVRGERFDPPLPLFRHAEQGDSSWRSPEDVRGYWWHGPEHVTDWTPARVVAESDWQATVRALRAIAAGKPEYGEDDETWQSMRAVAVGALRRAGEDAPVGKGEQHEAVPTVALPQALVEDWQSWAGDVTDRLRRNGSHDLSDEGASLLARLRQATGGAS